VAPVRDLLDRFRPAGAPGAATAAGVPADRRESAAAELEPVFAALAPVVAECDAVRATAASAGERVKADAAGRADAIVARARIEADAERVDVAARMRDHAVAEARLLADRAAADAEEVRRRAAARRPELVAAVLDRVRVELSIPHREAR
jgi:hypothetical protein